MFQNMRKPVLDIHLRNVVLKFERTMLKCVAVIAKKYKHTDPHIHTESPPPPPTHTHILPYLGHTFKK